MDHAWEGNNKMVAVRLSDLQRMQDSVATIISHMPREIMSAGLSTRVMKYELDRMDFDLRHLASGGIAAEECPPAVSAVFNNLDLLEMIFQQLDVHDLIQAVQTSRTTRALLEGSKRIRKILCLEPDPTFQGYLSLDASMLPKKFSMYTRKPDEFDPHATFNFWVRFEMDDPSPLLTPFIRSMLISQPPAKEFTVRLNCCGGPGNVRINAFGVRESRMTGQDPEECPQLLIKSEFGVTIGDMWDTVKRLRLEHRLCPAAYPSDHDEQGFVKVGMECRSRVILFSIPSAQRQQLHPQIARWNDRWRPKHPDKRLEAYIEHKRSRK